MDCSAEYLTCVFISRSPHTRKHTFYFPIFPPPPTTAPHSRAHTTNLTQVVFKSCLHLLFYCPTNIAHHFTSHRIFCQAHQLRHISVLTFQLHIPYTHILSLTHSLIHSLTHSLKIVCECNVLAFLLPPCRSSHVVDAKRKTPSHKRHTHTYALRQIKSEIKVLILLRHKQPRMFSRHLCDKADFQTPFKFHTSKAILYNVLAVCIESLRVCGLCWGVLVCLRRCLT